MNFDFQTMVTKIVWPAVGQTFLMVALTTLFASIIGFFLAIFVFISSDDGLRSNKVLHKTLDTIINVIRSFPFIILMVSIIPLTRLIAGSSVGTNAAVVPLTFASAPFMARLFDNSFKGVSKSLIEAAKSFGLTDLQIIQKVVVKESVPALVQSITLSVIAVLGSSAMAGAIGAGGLGSVAMTYGYQNFNDQVMYGTVVILVIIVQIIQFIGDKIYIRLK